MFSRSSLEIVRTTDIDLFIIPFLKNVNIMHSDNPSLISYDKEGAGLPVRKHLAL